MTRYERQFKELNVGDKVILTKRSGFRYGTNAIFPRCYEEKIKGEILQTNHDNSKMIYYVRMANHRLKFAFITGEIERAGD